MSKWHETQVAPMIGAGLKNIYADRGEVVVTDCIAFLSQHGYHGISGFDQYRVIAAELDQGELVPADKRDVINLREFVGTAVAGSEHYTDIVCQAQEIADDYTRRQAAKASA